MKKRTICRVLCLIVALAVLTSTCIATPSAAEADEVTSLQIAAVSTSCVTGTAYDYAAISMAFQNAYPVVGDQIQNNATYKIMIRSKILINGAAMTTENNLDYYGYQVAIKDGYLSLVASKNDQTMGIATADGFSIEIAEGFEFVDVNSGIRYQITPCKWVYVVATNSWVVQNSNLPANQITVQTVSSACTQTYLRIAMKVDSFANIGIQLQNPQKSSYGYDGYAAIRHSILIDGRKISKTVSATEIWEYQVHLKDGYLTIYTEVADRIAQLRQDGATVEIAEGLNVHDVQNTLYTVAPGKWKYDRSTDQWLPCTEEPGLEEPPLFGEKIDNSNLVPAYRESSEVQLESSDNGLLKSPDWVKSLIVMEANVEMVSADGTFAGMNEVLDHIQTVGANGLWLTPIQDGGGYGNFGPHTVNGDLTGTNDYEQGWKVVADFVAEAHRRNIRVFFDVVTWGTNRFSPLHDEHPEWFKEDLDPNYGGWSFNWQNETFRNWYIEQLVHMIEVTNADGFRCDCEPGYAGEAVFAEIRSRLVAKGHKIALFSESSNARTGAYDFDEHCTANAEDVWNINTMFTKKYNIVDATKSGTAYGTVAMHNQKNGGQSRFYSNLLSCHDSKQYNANGSLVNMAYTTLFSPTIPIWYLGEEYNQNYYSNSFGWLYSQYIDLTMQKDDPVFFEKVKKCIQIRRTYPEIFEYFPANHRETNICKVTTNQGSLQAYARYADGYGILIVPHDQTATSNRFTVAIPYQEMGLSIDQRYCVKDLLWNRVLAQGYASNLTQFHDEIAVEDVGIYLICAATDDDPPVEPTPISVTSVNSSISSSTAIVSMKIDSYANVGTQLQNPLCTNYGYNGYADVREKILINGEKIGDSAYAGDIWNYQIHVKDGYITVYSDISESMVQLSKDGAEIQFKDGFTVWDADNNCNLITAQTWKYHEASATWTKVVSAGERGDLNEDGFLSAEDVVLLKTLLLVGAPYEVHNDINQDGVLDVRDLVRLKKQIASG